MSKKDRDISRRMKTVRTSIHRRVLDDDRHKILASQNVGGKSLQGSTTASSISHTSHLLLKQYSLVLSTDLNQQEEEHHVW
jgi:hypothetical protein